MFGPNSDRCLLNHVNAIGLQIGDDIITSHQYALKPWLSTLPPWPSNQRARPSLLGRSALGPLPPWPLALPIDSPHLRLLSSYSFPPPRNHSRNHLSKYNSRNMSTHGLHAFPRSDSRHRHFFDVFIHSPRLPSPLPSSSPLPSQPPIPVVPSRYYHYTASAVAADPRLGSPYPQYSS
jgi:hypothetical protein